MSDFADRLSRLSPQKLALLAQELQARLQAAEQRTAEPIAIIGAGCRLPGADGPAAFWRLLEEGRDAIREVPSDRWNADAWYDPDPDVPGRMNSRWGGFLDDIDKFDPQFFGIAPREARTMDPQQRLLLEVSWEALEHAGQAPDRLGGTPTGVFVGISGMDYLQLIRDRAGLDNLYFSTGQSHAVAAGRISYILGLRGPALAVDTACSSSLVAVHLACQSLQSGECRLALAGGVNVILVPAITLSLSAAHMMAADGRCKTFADAADGFVRGEGCGVVVLKRLDDAVADGDRVLAVITGSAVNQDGTSSGLTAPNGPAQEEVIRAALRKARLAPADIDYVEAHGTGTQLGDPMEIRALARALGAGRESPLLVGSVKTNFGHLEATAGIAGLMKVMLALRHETIPRHLHFDEPSRNIDWESMPVRVAAEPVRWPRTSRPRRAGVSSFGFSGTNAHLILEEAPLLAPPPVSGERPLHCLPLSAKTPAALRAVAQRYLDAFRDGEHAIPDVAHTAATGRAHFAHRAAIVIHDRNDAMRGLERVQRGEHAREPTDRRDRSSPPEVVFMYTGQGAQYPGMGHALYQSAPVFRDVIDRCDALLGSDRQGRTLRDVLVKAGDAPPIHETAWTQPALFAIEYALTELWRSWGIVPAAVIGHSLGEYTAACVAGVFSLEDGLRLVAERARLMASVQAPALMAAVYASLETVAPLVSRWAAKAAIAAINAPDNIVISGARDTVEEILADLAERHIEAHRLFVSVAGHSPLMDPVLPALEQFAGSIAMSAPRIPVGWNLPGELVNGSPPDPGYWAQHARQPVRFDEGMRGLFNEGFRIFLEAGPHPTLLALAERNETTPGVRYLASLRRGKEEWGEMVGSLAALYEEGAEIDWAAFDRPYSRRLVTLPTYPFERSRHWVEPEGKVPLRSPSPTPVDQSVRRLSTATPIYETTLSPSAHPWLSALRVHGRSLAPGPLVLELAMQAIQDCFGKQPRELLDLAFLAPLFLRDQGTRLQITLESPEASNHEIRFSVYSESEHADSWTLHTTGTAKQPISAQRGSPDSPPSGQEVESADRYYDQLERAGVFFGPALRGLREIRRGGGRAWARVELPGAGRKTRFGWADPAMVEAILQATGLVFPEPRPDDPPQLLVGVARIALPESLPESVVVDARLRTAQGGSSFTDLTIRDSHGRPVGVIEGIRLASLPRELVADEPPGVGPYYRLHWRPAPLPASLSLPDSATFEEPLRKRFQAGSDMLDGHDRILGGLDRLSAIYIRKALLDLGFQATRHRRFTEKDEIQRLGILPKYGRLFHRMLSILAEEGHLELDGLQWKVCRPWSAVSDPRSPEIGSDESAELALLSRTGPRLSATLHGDEDPLELLFPGGSIDLTRPLYVESPGARVFNSLVAEVIRTTVASMPPSHRLRVLEIGAGTGGTTASVVPELPADRSEYTFTDVSPFFLERAKEDFAPFPFLRTALLDIEKDPVAQSFPAAGFDIIIAANVLHATADLRTTIRHVRSLLAPRGLLILVEGVAPERWVDLTFGLTDGWWRFADPELRTSHPLLSRQAWQGLLGECGLEDILFAPEDLSSRVAQQHSMIVARAPRPEPKRWVLVPDAAGIAGCLSQKLAAEGHQVELRIDAAHPLPDNSHLVYLQGLDLPASATEPAYPDALEKAGWSPVALLQSVARTGKGRAWLITRGIQARRATWQAPLWGLGRVFALEHPDHWGGLVDLAPDASIETAAGLLAQSLLCEDGEDQTSWEAGQRLALRLRPAEPPGTTASIHADATYLVTGAFGGLGPLVVRWLSEQGARHIGLLGRHPGTGPELSDLAEAGVQLIPLAADVGDRASLDSALAELRRKAPPLRGILHAAADLSLVPFMELDREAIDRMFSAKLSGSALLFELGRAEGLDFLVFFSSSTAVLGASGFAHYAAANAFLDALAAVRPASFPVASINWGTWERMRGVGSVRRREYREAGLLPMPAATALDGLSRVAGSDQTNLMIAEIDWRALKSLHEARRPRPLLSEIRIGESSPVQQRAQVSRELLESLGQLDATGRRSVLQCIVAEEVGKVLGQGGDTVAPEVGLFAMGMDSLMSVELRKRLETRIGRSLPSTLTFNYPTVNALADFLQIELERPDLGNGPVSVKETPNRLPEMTESELEQALRAKLTELR